MILEVITRRIQRSIVVRLVDRDVHHPVSLHLFHYRNPSKHLELEGKFLTPAVQSKNKINHRLHNIFWNSELEFHCRPIRRLLIFFNNT